MLCDSYAPHFAGEIRQFQADLCLERPVNAAVLGGGGVCVLERQRKPVLLFFFAYCALENDSYCECAPTVFKFETWVLVNDLL